MDKLIQKFDNIIKNNNNNGQIFALQEEILNIKRNMVSINSYMNDIEHILNKKVYGHDKAKKQIECVISQWINGEQKGNYRFVLDLINGSKHLLFLSHVQFYLFYQLRLLI